MKKLLVILYLILCYINSISAQGVVTVTQSSDIEAIVNGKKAKTKKQLKTEKKTTREDKKQSYVPVGTPSSHSRLQEPAMERVQTPVIPSCKPQSSNDIVSAPRTKLVRKLVKKPHVSMSDGEDGESQIVTKRLKHTFKKVRGFRVQVYSGGNTRIAHQDANKAGKKVKSLFPSQPVYVHFYTPRWMCLVGNFTNYHVARKIALKMRKAGYPNANVIRTIISVKTTQVVEETPYIGIPKESYSPY